MATKLSQRIRWYVYLIGLLAVAFSVQWSWWTYDERTLLEFYRDMGLVECLQILFLGLTGWGLCLLSRYRDEDRYDPITDSVFGQTLGLCVILLIFRELDYLATDFVDEAVFLLGLAALGTLAAFQIVRYAKTIIQGIRALFRTVAIWFMGVGVSLYIVVAQVVGTKQFRSMFHPTSRDFSRRFSEENIELLGIFIIFLGIIELHTELFQSGHFAHAAAKPSWQKIKGLKDEIWDAFTKDPAAAPSAFDSAGFGEEKTGVYMSHQADTVVQTEPIPDERALVLSERLVRQLKDVERATLETRRSFSRLTITLLVVGLLVTWAVLWRGFIARQTAIEDSTNRQLEILAAQYNHRVSENDRRVREFNNRSVWWKIRHASEYAQLTEWGRDRAFRYEPLREAIRRDVASKYTVGSFLKREAHRG